MKQVKGNQQLVIHEADMLDVVDYKWRKLPDEPNRAYQYFKLYLGLPVPRKLDRVAAKTRLSRGAIGAYSAKYKWLERADAYDNNENNKELEKKRRHREKIDEQWLERRDEQRQQEWDIAQQFLNKVRQMLNTPLFRETVTEYLDSLDPQGRIIIKQVITYEPLDWSPSDMAKFFEIGSKIARLATGQETDRKKIKIDFGKLSDAELDELLTEG
jgi:hypothetical protein